MPIATFRGEKTAAEIADKLFIGLTPRQREKAEAALLKANPQLKDIQNVREGSILRIPDLPELRPKTNRNLDNPDAQIAKDVTEALRDYAKQSGQRVAQAAADAKAQTALLKSAKFKKAVAGQAGLQALAGEAGKALEARTKSLAEREELLQQAVKQLVKDLNKGFG